MIIKYQAHRPLFSVWIITPFFDDFFTLLKTLGEKFNCQNKAAILLREYKQKLKKEQRKVSSRQLKKRVFFEVRYHDHSLIVAGAKSIVNEIIKLAKILHFFTSLTKES